MTTETEKSPREIAKAFVEKWANYANSVDAVEQLLISRDERAAKIAEAHHHDGPSASLTLNRPATMGYKLAAHKVASAIRGKS
jgi:hypothetical protein